MRTRGASAVGARRHNESDITMTIGDLWRYGDWQHVATGCTALVWFKFSPMYFFSFVFHYFDLLHSDLELHIFCYRYNKSSAVAEMGMGDGGHNRHGPKIGGGYCAPFAGAGTQFSTMWPGPRSTSVPSGVIIYPAIWPQ